MSDDIESDEIELVTHRIEIITDLFDTFYEVPDTQIQPMLDRLSVEEAAAIPLGDPTVCHAFMMLRDWADRVARVRHEVNEVRRAVRKSREQRAKV